MKKHLLILLVMVCSVAGYAETFNYRFNSTPLSEALSRIAEEHPSLNLNFIYNELENYRTSAHIKTNYIKSAIRILVGLTPVTVISKGNTIFIEALQHGRYCFTGQAVSTDSEPVAGATVFLLAPKDSTVITYGITDESGRFSIPCDRKRVIAKLSCIGYRTVCRNTDGFALGSVIMPELPKNLGQIVVEGSTQKVIQNGVMYVPGKRIKKAALDATSLLFHMQIPQLRVSPTDNSVKTAAGNDVTLFIDYHQATPQDAQGLRPEDVMRVEVLDYPVDSRFMGAPHVVNFIMQKYEWGGYTKLTAAGRTLNNDLAEGRAYQKFVHKKWTFDASASANGTWENKNSDYSKETYRDFSFDGRHYDSVVRESYTDGYKGKNDSQNVALRGSYAGEKTYMINTLSFSRTAAKENTERMNVEFSDNLLPATSALQNSPQQSISVKVGGWYQFTMPKGNSIIASWSFSHSGNNRRALYELGDLPGIVNYNKEKVYNPNLTLFYSKKLNHNNTIRTMFSSYANIYDTRYYGSYDGTQKLISTESMLFLEYMQNWGNKLNLYSRLGISYVLGRVNGKNYINEWGPRLGLQLNYTINTRNSVSIEGWWANSTPQPSTANTAFVRQNELLWHQGNPDLKNIYGPLLSISYSFIPTNRFSMSASINYNLYRNMALYLYRPLDGRDGIVRTFTDRNNDHELFATLNASLRLFDNSLVLTGIANWRREISSAGQVRSLNSWTGTGVRASYYYKNASVILYYDTPQKSIMFNRGYKYSFGSTYGIIATYSVGNFKAQASFRNWFNKGNVHTDYDSQYYSIHNRSWNMQIARSLSLSLSYTFTYGKKVKLSEDLNNDAYKKSAILE